MNAILDQKFHTLSDRYQLVKTNDIITKIEGLGLQLDDFIVNRVRKAEKRGFQKHRALFSSPSLLKSSHNDGKAQILLTNSHDGLSSLELRLGFFRLVCSNDTVVGSNIIAPIRIRHKGQDCLYNVDKAVETMVAQLTKLDNSIDLMKSKQLSLMDILEFQKEAISLRLDDTEMQNFFVPLMRSEDKGQDVWRQFNRLQEGLIRGGIKYTDNTGKLRTIKKVNSLTTQMEINTKLWDIAAKYAA